ncbi:MAG TPA: acyl-CoA dehydrogenase family protein [Candidatus Binatia bacterium]|jgi:alkylation response protein AidB-like acyl-CoA dehydrogenase|nr:acyl-CoA dehydrogenase family protein [Candidatus Binatia bacterium]
MSDMDTFREDTRRWLEEHAPPAMRTPPRIADEVCWGGKKGKYPDDTRRWLALMAERGWTAPTWPREYGGGGLTKEQAKVLSEEMAKLRLRPALIGFGLEMIGPLLLQTGTEEQKREHLPRITRGEIRWCQGYSEPGAGSDLAGLQTRAVRDGDDYILNGQKVWTSYGEKSDWMFILVRTDTEKKHAGITFLLMDMEVPGVTVAPIKLISGASPFCETFLTDVIVPRRNVIGEENGGWAIAKMLLRFERNMIADVFKERDDRSRLLKMARRYLPVEDGRIADPILRDRITQMDMDQLGLDLTLSRSRDRLKAGQAPGPETSIFKLYGTELNQRRRELMMSIAGPQSLGWEGTGFADDELTLTRDWLRSRGNTIEGGTSEVQLNIIAKQVLGLPD